MDSNYFGYLMIGLGLFAYFFNSVPIIPWWLSLSVGVYFAFIRKGFQMK